MAAVPQLSAVRGIWEQVEELDAVVSGLFAPLDAHVSDLSVGSGMPVDQIKNLLCIAAMIPLALVLRALPHGIPRHAVSMVTGLGFGLFCFGTVQMLIPLATTVVAWLFIVSGAAGGLVLSLLVATLSACHIYRQYTDYMGWTLDFTGPQMILTMKLSMLALNVADGRRTGKISDMHRRYAVPYTPSLLSVLSYVFTGMGFLAGPAVEFAVFSDLMDGPSRQTKKAEKEGSGVRPSFASCVGNALVSLLVSVACAFVFMHGSMFPVEHVLTPGFRAMSIWEKTVYVWAVFEFIRAKYYFVWKLSESASILAGMGVPGLPDPFYDVRGVSVWGFDTAMSIKTASDSWNARAAHWLRYYVYDRVPFAGLKLTGTYLVSAAWHGFYPGYYVMFGLVGFFQHTGREVRRRVRPFFVGSRVGKFLYDIATWAATQIALDQGALAFVLLSWERAAGALQAYPYGIIGGVVVFLAVQLVPRQKRDLKRE